MKKDKIIELIKIIEDHEIDEIEVSRWGSRIRVTKFKGNKNYQANALSKSVAEVQDSVHVEKTDVSSFKETIIAPEETNGYEVKSPMVGTFYRAPAPDADPYVKIGDYVSVGQSICIIEAMKIMNVIESEVVGKIKRILVDDAQPVEFNQTIFTVEES